MRSELFVHHEIAVGLDISDHVLRLALLKPGRQPQLQAAASIDVPEGVIVRGEIMQIEKVIELCKKLRQKAGHLVHFAHYAVACLPEPTSFLKLLTINPTTSGDLKNDIFTEATAHLPMSIEEVYLDWQIISPTENYTGPLKVLVAAAPRLTIDRYIKVLTKANFEPIVLEIEPISIGRAVLSEDNEAVNQTVAVVDLGATRTGLTVFENLIPQFSVSLPVSGYNWTAAIAKALNLNLDQAEDAKIKCGLNNPDCQQAINEVIGESLNELARLLQEAMGYYEGHFNPKQKLQRLIITGGGAQMRGLAEFLQQQLQVKVCVAQPLKNINYQKIKLNPGQDLQYSTALGLARRALIKQSL